MRGGKSIWTVQMVTRCQTRLTQRVADERLAMSRVLDPPAPLGRRVFLDAAELIRIADGKEPDVSKELLDVMGETNSRLLVTRELLQDTISNVDEATKERVVRALERFTPLLLALENPMDVEPIPASSFQVALVSDIRSFAVAAPVIPWMADANAQTDRVHVGQVAALDALRRTGAATEPLKDRHVDLYLRTVITRLRGWDGTDTASILERHRQTDGIELSAPDESKLLARIAAVDAMLDATGVTHSATDWTEVLRSLASWGRDPLNSPGANLVLRLTAARLADLRRTPQRSDFVDLLHAATFPYVDVCTCDRFMFALLAQVGFPTSTTHTTVVPNGNLALVTAALRSAGKQG